MTLGYRVAFAAASFLLIGGAVLNARRGDMNWSTLPAALLWGVAPVFALARDAKLRRRSALASPSGATSQESPHARPEAATTPRVSPRLANSASTPTRTGIVYLALFLGGVAVAMVAVRQPFSAAAEDALEVINTSGKPLNILVVAASGDTYLKDSLLIGSSLCWTLPEYARGERVTVFLNPPIDVRDPVHTETWTDSLLLRGTWRLRAHQLSFTEGTPDWHRAQEQRKRVADQWLERSRRQIARGRSSLSEEQLLERELILLRDPDPFNPQAPHYATVVSIQRANGCSQATRG